MPIGVRAVDTITACLIGLSVLFQVGLLLLDYARNRTADRSMAKKLKNEKGLLKVALDMILEDAVKRGVVEFEATDSHNLKIEYAYRLLVHDKSISPLPRGQETLPKIRHRLAMWVTHKLPVDHELL